MFFNILRIKNRKKKGFGSKKQHPNQKRKKAFDEFIKISIMPPHNAGD